MTLTPEQALTVAEDIFLCTRDPDDLNTLELLERQSGIQHTGTPRETSREAARKMLRELRRLGYTPDIEQVPGGYSAVLMHRKRTVHATRKDTYYGAVYALFRRVL